MKSESPFEQNILVADEEALDDIVAQRGLEWEKRVGIRHDACVINNYGAKLRTLILGDANTVQTVGLHHKGRMG